MAETVRRLANRGSFSNLQDKLEKWQDLYHLNSCDQNVSRCVDLIESNSQVQAELFRVLSLISAEGGLYGGSSVIRSRLLPWLGTGLFPYSGAWPYLPALPAPSTADLIAESVAKDREITDLQDMYERSLTTLEDDLNFQTQQADDLKAELDEAKDSLEVTKRESASEKMFAENELTDLRAKLRVAEDELISLRSRASLVDNYERQIRRLREDVAVLAGRREALLSIEPLPLTSSVPSLPEPPYRSLSRSGSPLAPDDLHQRVRSQNLITRFNDMYAQDRLDALDTLRRYCDDNENNQRIIFAIMAEAFSAAKLAFGTFKLKVRANLAGTHVGPSTLEETVQDYINRNTDLCDLPGLVSNVIRSLNRNPHIYLPPDASYSIVQPFVREACKLAWNMTALAYPLDVSLAVDAELHDDKKYRRSYDSEYTAPLVNHHIWPCLTQNARVIMKGESCTKRGASLSPSSRRSRSRSRSRSASPLRSLSAGRSLSPSRAFTRSRSPSPRRKQLDSGFSGKSSLGGSRASHRSSSPSRVATSSTNLSHYGVLS